MTTTKTPEQQLEDARREAERILAKWDAQGAPWDKRKDA